MLEILFSVLLTAMVAVAAWFVAHFVGNPFIKFYSLRERIHQSLFFTANVGTDDPRLDKAVEELRRHAAALDALLVTLPRFPKWFLNKRATNLLKQLAELLAYQTASVLRGEKKQYTETRLSMVLIFPGPTPMKA